MDTNTNLKYIINLSIVFNPGEKSLSLQENDALKVGLSNPANRLLLEMLNHNGKVLSRDELLTRVWEDFGFQGSNNNLSTYVSELRKAFSSLNKDMMPISTVPRIGFKFEADVTPVLPAFAVKEEPAVAPEIPRDPIVPAAKSSSSFTVKHFEYTFFAVAAVFIIALIARFIYAQNTHDTFTLQNVRYSKASFTIKKCDVFEIDTDTNDIHIDLQPAIENALSENNIQCDAKAKRRSVFYAFFPQEDINTMTLFIGSCLLNDNGGYKKCVTIIKRDYHS